MIVERRKNFLLIGKKFMLYLFTKKDEQCQKFIDLLRYFRFAATFLSVSFKMSYSLFY